MTNQDYIELTLWGEDRLGIEHTFYHTNHDSKPRNAGTGIMNVARALSQTIVNNPAVLQSIEHPDEPHSHKTHYDHAYLSALRRCLSKQGHKHINIKHPDIQEATA